MPSLGRATTDAYQRGKDAAWKRGWIAGYEAGRAARSPEPPPAPATFPPDGLAPEPVIDGEPLSGEQKVMDLMQSLADSVAAAKAARNNRLTPAPNHERMTT